MRKMVRMFALGAALCAGFGSAAVLQAQDASTVQQQHRGPMTPEQELGNLTKALSLSPEQQAKIKPILDERHAQLMSLHENNTLPRGQKSEHMKQIDEGANAKLLGVLNGEQKTKYQAMIEQRRERREAMQHGRGGSGPNQE